MMKPFVLLFISLLVCVQSVAQVEDRKVKTSESEIISDYFRDAQGQAAIYNGKEQTHYPNSFTDHPYLFGTEYIVGSLSYDGIVYQELSMRFDMYRNDLILQTPDKLFGVVLQRDKVDYVKLLQYTFFYFTNQGLKGSPSNGYCILLHDGPFPVIEKHHYTLSESRNNRTVEYSFNKVNRFYVLKDNVYHSVKNKRSLLKVFKSHKKELSQFIKQQNLDFKHEQESSIPAVVKEYERLIKQQ